jgi:hypothetical protein
MNTDIAFVTGSSHRVCQDYARRGEDFIVLSDGCSSSPDTDFGARILVKAACDLLQYDRELIKRQLILDAANILDELNLPNESLDATLLAAAVHEHHIDVTVVGDGFLWVKYTDGSWRLTQFEFPTNYPFYLNYLRSRNRLEALEALYRKDGFKTLLTWEPTASGIKHESHQIEMVPAPQLDVDSRVGVLEMQVDTNIVLPKDTTEIVVLMSDGLGSFVDGSGQAISPLDVCQELCNFKNYTGEVVQRRLNAFLRDTAKKGWKHFDDVSVGAIFKPGEANG